MSAIAGWYPDPAGSVELRYWDGVQWSQATVPRPRSTVAAQQPATAVATLATPAYPVYAAYSAYSHPNVPHAPATRYLPYAPSQPKRGRSRLVKLLVALGVFVALCVGATVAVAVQDHAATEKALHHTTIQLPDQVAGLHKITGSLGSEITASAASIDWLDHQTGGYALADGTPRAVVTIAKIGVGSEGIDTGLPHAESGFNSATAAKGLPATVFSKVAPGPLGGRMDCGTLGVASRTVMQCFFVDRAAIGSLTMYDVDGSDDYTLALQLRSAIETRS